MVVNRLRSNGEVAGLRNGMSRSVRLTRAKVLDEVNKYYNGRWKVKVGRFLDKHVKRGAVSSWEHLVVLVAMSLVMVLGLQAFSTGLGLKFWALSNWRKGSP